MRYLGVPAGTKPLDLPLFVRASDRVAAEYPICSLIEVDPQPDTLWFPDEQLRNEQQGRQVLHTLGNRVDRESYIDPDIRLLQPLGELDRGTTTVAVSENRDRVEAGSIGRFGLA